MQIRRLFAILVLLAVLATATLTPASAAIIWEPQPTHPTDGVGDSPVMP